MLNIEKYKDEILKVRKKNGTSSDCAIGIVRKGHCDTQKCIECHYYSLIWLFQEYKEPILDDAERKYLSAVIKPFRKRVRYIAIWICDGTKRFVHIELDDGDYVNLPNFKANTMYKGMEPKKHYSLEELGL